MVKMSVVGLSYGGFVAYNMAAQFKDCVEKVVICCAGVCLEEKDLQEGLFAVNSVEDAANILLPQTAEQMRELMGYTFVKAPAKVLPSCLLTDFIDVSVLFFNYFFLHLCLMIRHLNFQTRLLLHIDLVKKQLHLLVN